jgi:hypothetical protein
MAYGMVKLGLIKLRLKGSKKLQSTGEPGAGGVKGNLLVKWWVPVELDQGSAKPGQ